MTTLICNYCREPVIWDELAEAYQCRDIDCEYCQVDSLGAFRHTETDDCGHFMYAVGGINDEADSDERLAGER